MAVTKYSFDWRFNCLENFADKWLVSRLYGQLMQQRATEMLDWLEKRS